MRMYDPDIANIISNLNNKPTFTAFKSFADVIKPMREIHGFLTSQREQFETKYNEKRFGGKFTMSGLNDLRADFEDAYKPVRALLVDDFKAKLDDWKDREQKNLYAIINKAPTDDQARQLEVVLKRDNISKTELELWAKGFGDNYLCASAFRDYAERKGYLIVYSDFTDADERLEDINKAYEFINSRLPEIDVSNADLSYTGLTFFGTDEDGEYYQNSFLDAYIDCLDSDPTFKPQTIDIKPIVDTERTEREIARLTKEIEQLKAQLPDDVIARLEQNGDSQAV